MKHFTHISTHRCGFTQTFMLIVIALVILAYIGFDMREIIASEMVQEDIGYIRAAADIFWDKYLHVSLTYLYETFRDYVWVPLIAVIK
jgi:hypothetical protein